MGKIEFSLHAASIFSELKENTDLELGIMIMYSSLFAEIEGLEKVRISIIKYRDYPFRSPIAMNKGLYVVKKLDSKILKLKSYLKSMPLDEKIDKCNFWENMCSITGIKL